MKKRFSRSSSNTSLSFRLALAVIGFLVASGCTSQPPSQRDNVCSIFKERPSWYRAAQRSSSRWDTPISLAMAIMFQESSFRARARPPREKIFGVLPWRRPSSAYGYAQATNATWSDYRRAAGKAGASRTQFADAVDFVAWYVNRANRELGGLTPRQHYLAYHQGLGGYRRGTYQGVDWLQGAATSVANREERFSGQLDRCRDTLRTRRWFG